MIRLFVIAFFLTFTGCRDQKTEKLSKTPSTRKSRDFGPFSMDIPPDWIETIKSGPDFEILTFANNDSDTFRMYLGNYAQYPLMAETIIFPKKMEKEVKSSCSDSQIEIAFGDKMGLDRNRINNRCFVFETISGLNTRFIFPKDKKTGTARFFIDSLNSSKLQIDFWGEDLTPEKQEAFFNICRTTKLN